MLYTSGSTGKPKGVLHTTAGYMVGAYTSFKYIFDSKPEDVWFCTADCGWITGHTYVVYGPLLMGSSSLIFEGVPTHPDAGRLWKVCDKWKVSTRHTSTTYRVMLYPSTLCVIMVSLMLLLVFVTGNHLLLCWLLLLHRTPFDYYYSNNIISDPIILTTPYNISDPIILTTPYCFVSEKIPSLGTLSFCTCLLHMILLP